jgi:N-succinyldiaminopimelate aminotransferase
MFGGRTLDPETQVAVATSATEALLAAFYAAADPGDEAIVVEPFFPWYLPQLKMAGAVPVPVRMQTPCCDGAGFEVPLDGIRRAITPRTRLLIHNTPHNPTGTVATAAVTAGLAQLCVDNDLICISDEVYHRHTFTSQRPHTRISDQPGMAERTLTVNSAGKLLNCTGWRVGWLSSHSTELLAAASLYRGFCSYCAPTPLQVGVAAALDTLHVESDPNRDIMRANYEDLAAALRGRGLAVYGADGGYFLVADCTPLGIPSAMEYCRSLVEECGVVCAPLAVFYTSADAENEGLLRFALCKSRECIREVCARLYSTS